ncbi:thioesterase family protein [Hymenobacter negativus]|uniref:Thioesterase family protein n=1 Tax=Hymenobacter negativus TaxID=2795026 RepID=A0ABS0QAR7_9BACT|nr:MULTISPECIES: thioesterase family protein [Bacteria]MBH8559763.1 thioesterase family protein [Hymenobacter negativus]MBH8570645.1 thioesterase family protein [Hymenobacter negativus]MBR7210383.1 thioesterase family protein [Microvirga sp. STS02]
MPRVKVALPAAFPFATDIPVRITDLNYGGHLGNDALLGLLHEARVHFLRSVGLDSDYDAVTKLGLIMVDVAVEYKGEAFHGDVLRFQMAGNDLSKYGFDVVYHVHNQAGKEIARAKTGMLCFDYNIRKLRPLPPELAARL